MKKSIHTPEYQCLLAALRHARKGAQLSQRDLASRLEVPHSWVAKVEIGERRIDVVEFCWFMSACGVEPHAGFELLSRQVAKGKAGRRIRGGQSK